MIRIQANRSLYLFNNLLKRHVGVFNGDGWYICDFLDNLVIINTDKMVSSRESGTKSASFWRYPLESPNSQSGMSKSLNHLVMLLYASFYHPFLTFP